MVTVSEPIRPAIRTPLKTRPGVAQAPIEPGLRWFLWAPCEEETPWKPCRFMTPAKPLPLLVPVTSISSPAAKVSTGSSWPTANSPAVVVRISTRCRRGVVPAVWKWPARGLFTLRPSISPNPTWMAL